MSSRAKIVNEDDISIISKKLIRSKMLQTGEDIEIRRVTFKINGDHRTHERLITNVYTDHLHTQTVISNFVTEGSTAEALRRVIGLLSQKKEIENAYEPFDTVSAICEDA